MDHLRKLKEDRDDDRSRKLKNKNYMPPDEEMDADVL